MALVSIEPGSHNPFPEERIGDCPATSPRDDAGPPYFCTRDAGHPPPHVAVCDLGPAMAAALGLTVSGEVVAAVWPPFRELDPGGPVVVVKELP